MELREGGDEVAGGDLIVFEVEAGEQRLVEHAALFVVAAQVERLGVPQ
ncbi:hypothetical protein [Amycolatopsis alkalitolerans]|nr:hypothetical protein [Amycolatopsis alkalitolerans]